MPNPLAESAGKLRGCPSIGLEPGRASHAADGSVVVRPADPGVERRFVDGR